VSAAIVAVGGQARAASQRIDVVVYDERYSDARRFADALQARGVLALATGSDLAGLWHGSRSRSALQAASRIAGFTPDSDLYIVRSMTARQGLRVLYSAMHDGRGARVVRHRLQSGAALDDIASAVASANATWPSVLAGALDTTALVERPNRLVMVEGAPRAVDFPGTLVSWVVGSR
jgi:hypothetical protein